jgi:Arc/MetJ-type ribon-helix-helix transcriptional regulator
VTAWVSSKSCCRLGLTGKLKQKAGLSDSFSIVWRNRDEQMRASFLDRRATWYDVLSYPEAFVRTAKIAVTIDAELLSRLDRLVRERRFPNRSRAVAEALRDKLERLERSRLARECAKLDREVEQQLAEEGLAQESGPCPCSVSRKGLVEWGRKRWIA